MHTTLSRQATSLWAKTGDCENPQLWESLPVHLSDTGEVCRLIWNQWLSNHARKLLCKSLGLSSICLESLLVWLGATHDIGKATQEFQAKDPTRAEAVRETGLYVPAATTGFSHAFAGQFILTNWLEEKGWDEWLANQAGSVVGGHHGTNPNDEDLRTLHGCIEDPMWHAVQCELLDWAYVESGASALEHELCKCSCSTYVQIVLTGFIIMADWIASNVALFPLAESLPSWDCSRQRAKRAWEELRLPGRFEPDQNSYDLETLFHLRFEHIPPTSSLTSTQSSVLKAISQADEPCLYIVEDNMGSGKTEAALLGAELLMQRFGLGGIAYLLPTQATTNAMFTRVHAWLSSLLSSQTKALPQGLHLVHGKAALNKDFGSLTRWQGSWMGDGGASDDLVITHQWFGGSKRSLLAGFVVATIDQILIAALNARHVHLRHLGLAGKVVIIDEVHAYDAYMSVYLDRILQFLGKYQVPVILLSATLPLTRRKELLAAYSGKVQRRRRVLKQVPEAPRLPSDKPCYPLMSCSPNSGISGVSYVTPAPSGNVRHVQVRFMPDDTSTLIRTLNESLADGGCICILRDTVGRAQATYQALRTHFGDNVKVCIAHSRYIALDRSVKDRSLVNLLGPDRTARPHAMIVVGTQVIEQSLDLDFDLMISDIAPIDLILQRMGRLHRHPTNTARPNRLSIPRFLVTGIEKWDSGMPSFEQGCAAVYHKSLLYRTTAAIQQRAEKNGGIDLPSDISPMVEQVYERTIDVPAEWEQSVQEATMEEDALLARKHDAANQWLLPLPSPYTLIGWTRAKTLINADVIGRAAVRDIDETLEVTVVIESNGHLELLPWVAESLEVDPVLGDGTYIPPEASARAAALCTVSLPPLYGGPNTLSNLAKSLLSTPMATGWQESPWLRDAIPLALDNRREVTVTCEGKEYRFRYDRETGLERLDKKGGAKGNG